MEIDTKNVGFLEKFIKANPKTANLFIDFDVNMQYSNLGEKGIHSVDLSEKEAAVRRLKDDPTPAIGYNNGVYCLTSYEYAPGRKDVFYPKCHLFADRRIAEEMKKMGAKDVWSDYYVPMSNGQHTYTVPNLNILHKMAENFDSPIESKSSNQAVLNKLMADKAR
ncbi:MAG: hypothetical protein MJ250_02070 [Alphaproteobacteria bacterium]|nr:hypothetical protein [Alphaproteobacteria bacterium]